MYSSTAIRGIAYRLGWLFLAGICTRTLLTVFPHPILLLAHNIWRDGWVTSGTFVLGSPPLFQ